MASDGAIGNALSEKRRQFTETWKCCICHELPSSPFLTQCGHCLCYSCAVKLPSSGGSRVCPLCKDRITSIKLQLHLAQTLESLAEFLWPEVWAFWLQLKSLPASSTNRIFTLLSSFVSLADDDTIQALQLFRFSQRYDRRDSLVYDMLLEPLMVTEAGYEWDGIGPWLGRVLDKCTMSLGYCLLASVDAAAPFLATEAAASRLLPVLARITSHGSKCQWVTRAHLRLFQGIAETHISLVKGGWTTLVDAPGFKTLAPVLAIARLFAAAPTARMLYMLCDAIEAQAGHAKSGCGGGTVEALLSTESLACAVSEQAGSDDGAGFGIDGHMLDAVALVVTEALAALAASDAGAVPAATAAAPAIAVLDVAVARFIWLLCSKLPPESASAILHRHGLVPRLREGPLAGTGGALAGTGGALGGTGVCGDTASSSSAAPSATALATESTAAQPEGRKRSRGTA